jgi:hypothetical protein
MEQDSVLLGQAGMMDTVARDTWTALKKRGFMLSCGSPFLTKKLFTAFLGIPGRSISKVSKLSFNSYELLLPSGPLAPTRCNPS